MEPRGVSMKFKPKSLLILVIMLGVGLAPMAGLSAAEKSKTKTVSTSSKAKSARPPAKKASAVNSKAKSAAAKAPAAKKTAAKPGKKKANVNKTAAVRSDAPSDGRLAVQSGSALVVEQSGGGTLYQKNVDAVVPIASITKLMTAMVVLDGAPDLHANIAIGDEDVDYLRGSRSRLHVGASMTRETALLLALMSSENRAAHALARHYPAGEQAFIAAMNAKARALGMVDTHFEDPTGLTSNNVSTAQDLVKMVRAAHRYPLIREFSTTPEATVEIAGQPLEFHNTNPLVKSASWDVGLSKTGYIHEAGKCLVMQARVAGKPVVIVLLDSAGRLTRVGDANRIRRWMENTYAMHKYAAPVDHAAAELPGRLVAIRHTGDML